jgi:L-cysteine:1D-myo-inositol 2-amino-2-deoxy-alpha-D-glucopyranoside ligase
MINDIVSDISNNLDTPNALKRLLNWSFKSNSDGNVNQSGAVARAIDALLGLAL